MLKPRIFTLQLRGFALDRHDRVGAECRTDSADEDEAQEVGVVGFGRAQVRLPLQGLGRLTPR